MIPNKLKKLFRFKQKKNSEYGKEIEYSVYVHLWYGNHNVHSLITFDDMQTAVDFLKWIVKDPNYHCTKICRKRYSK